MQRIAGFCLLLLLTARALAEPDYSSPKAAFRTYTQALADGDQAAMKASVIASEKQMKMLIGLITYGEIEKKFRAAVIKVLPEAAKELPEPAKDTLKAIDAATVKIDGESALLITHQSVEPVKLKRQGGKWLVDISSMYNDDSVNDILLFKSALADVMTDMIADIEAAKFKDFAEVKTNLEMRLKMRIAMPPEDATTKPAG